MASDNAPPDYQVTNPPTDQPPTLVIEGVKVFSLDCPSRMLYELSNPVCEIMTTVYGIEKIRHRVTDADYEPKVRSRHDHIYDFENDYRTATSRNIRLNAKASSKRVYHNLVMALVHPGYCTVKVPGHFTAERSVLGRIRSAEEIVWKDDTGEVVAVELRAARDKNGQVKSPPRLALKSIIEERDLDLLVTCWCARVWKESEECLKEPLTWKKFKQIASKKGSGKSWFLGGVGGGAAAGAMGGA